MKDAIEQNKPCHQPADAGRRYERDNMRTFLLLFILITLSPLAGGESARKGTVVEKSSAELEKELREALSKQWGAYSKRSLALFYYEKEMKGILDKLSKDKELGERAKYYIRKFYPNANNDRVPPWLKPSKSRSLKTATNVAIGGIKDVFPGDPKITFDASFNRSKNRVIVIVTFSEGALSSLSYALFFEKKKDVWELICGDSAGMS